LSTDRPELESRLESLSARLAEVERRLAALEGAAVPRRVETPEPAAPPSADDEAERPQEPRAETLPLIGRTIVVLAGAFLLRALTEMGVLQSGLGTAAGFVYGVLWLALADVSAGRGRRTGAMFHGIAAAMIVFPLIWEVTVEFEYLSPAAGAAALLAASVLALIVVWRRDLRRLAWVFTVGAGSAALVLAVATRSPALFATFLLVLGFGTLWLGWLRGWQGPGWLAAAFVDLAIFLLTTMVLAGRSEQVMQILNPESVVGLQLSFLLVYCGSLGAHTLGAGRTLRAGEVVQGAASVALGLGGAFVITQRLGDFTGRLGVVSFVLALGCYAAAFAFIDRRSGSRTNFVFFTTAALLFALVGIDALLVNPWSSYSFAAAAVATAALGASRSRATLSLHGVAYALVAALASGHLVGGVDAFVGAGVPEPGVVTLAWVVALAAAAICAFLPVATHGRTWGRFSLSPKVAVLVVVIVGTAGLVVVLGTPLLPAGEDGPDAGALAALRTGVLVLAVLLLAWLGRTERHRVASWLVYPLLGAGGVKLLLEDLPAGRAATLFLSLALYGLALLLAPRLRR
jgi:hypothetical protein